MGLNIISEVNFLGFYENFSQRFTKMSGGTPSRAVSKVNTGNFEAKQPVMGVAEYEPIVMMRYVDFGPDDALINQIEIDFLTAKRVKCIMQRVEVRAGGIVTPVGLSYTFFDCSISKWITPKADGDSSTAASIEITLEPTSRKLNFTNI